MINKVVAAAIATATLALTAPAAHAAAMGDCDMVATPLPGVHQGYAWGYAVTDEPGGIVSVYCEVRVNGGTQASTPPGPYGQTSATAGEVTYFAGPTDVVELCAVWYGPESGEHCEAYPPLDPQTVVIGLCPLLTSVPDVPPALVIGSDGDVYVAGVKVVDCPPYEV